MHILHPMKDIAIFFSSVFAGFGLISSLSGQPNSLSFVIGSSILLFLYVVFGEKLNDLRRFGNIDPRERNPNDFAKNPEKYNHRNFKTLEDKISESYTIKG